jgi:class 3 adenylate cyclase
MAGSNQQQFLIEGELETFIEQLAVKVHQAWMHERQTQGWTFGKQLDHARRKHPSLIEYDCLPESEKEVDRRTVRATIEALRELGYRPIKTNELQAGVSASLFDQIRHQLSDRSRPLGTAELYRLWNQCRSLAQCPPDLHIKIGESVLKRGEPILAYDILSHGLALLGEKTQDAQAKTMTLRLRQLLCLALAQSGATERARGRLEELCRDGHDNPETLGLLGRVHKDRALKFSSKAQRLEALDEAFRIYRRGFQIAEARYGRERLPADAQDAYYCGINAAATAVLRGSQKRARPIAQRVRQICEELLQQAPSDYWLLATLGEAELILAHFENARQWYRQAIDQVGDNWREFSTTRRQLRLLVAALGESPKKWDSLFPSSAVVAFASPDRKTARSASQKWLSALRHEVKKRTKKCRVIAAYINAMTPAEVVAGETMLEQGAEVHVILPFSRQTSARFFPSVRLWRKRFDELLAHATSVTDDAGRNGVDNPANRDFSALRANGSAWLRARRLDVPLLCWTLQDVPRTGTIKTDLLLTGHWQRLSDPPKELVNGDAGSDSSEPRQGARRNTPDIVAAGSHEILAMLFADVSGFSKLDDASLLRFCHAFMGEIARVLDGFGTRILARRTAGDGLFLVFSDFEAAAETAVALRDKVVKTPWQSHDLPPNLAMRFSLDAGPVYSFQDAVMGRPDFCGAYVNRAARIEPITPPNQVYASEAFASLYVAVGGRKFHFDYVGQTELPKGYGMTPLYCLS